MHCLDKYARVRRRRWPQLARHRALRLGRISHRVTQPVLQPLPACLAEVRTVLHGKV